jgi:hypothetical protein
MTIQAWNIVLNAVVAVVLVAYGLWLRNIVTQQLKTKDTAIEALEAVIKIKDAEISASKSDTAPAITKAYAEMREHADKMTADVLRLSEQLTKAVEDYKRLQQTMREAQERSLVEVTEKLDHWENVLNKRFLLLVGTEHKKNNETE